MIRLGKWWRDRRGVAAVEAAFAFPLIILLTMGCIELSLMMLLDASLEMGIAEASRAGSLTLSGGQAAREENVKRIVDSWVSRWVPGTSAITIETAVYPNLSDVGKPTWVDRNNNDTCDVGEGTCPPTGVELTPGIGISGSLVLYSVTVSRKGFSGVLTLAGIESLKFSRQTVVLNE